MEQQITLVQKDNKIQGYSYNQIIYDDQGRIIDFIICYASQFFAENIGLKMKEIEGKKASEIFPRLKNGPEKWFLELEAALKNGGRFQLKKDWNGSEGKFDVSLLNCEGGFFEMFMGGNGRSAKEKQALEKLLVLTEEFIKNPDPSLNYKKIADYLRTLVGAKFVLVNLYNETRDKFKTVAVSGDSNELNKAEKLFGEMIKGREWPSPPQRVRKLKKENLTCFSGLKEKLAGTHLEKIGWVLEQTLNLGPVAAIEVASPGQALANLIIIMDRGEAIRYPEIIELFTGHIELLMEKERAEKALKQSEEKFRLLFNHAPLGLFHFNDQGKITACNQQFLDIFSLEREDIEKYDMLNLPEKFGGKGITEVLKGNSTTFSSSYFSKKRGREVTFRALFAPLERKEKNPGGVMGLVEDISSRRAAEKALQEREDKLQSILETAPIGIGVEKDEKIQECNGYLAKITGYSTGQLVGEEVRLLYASTQEYEEAKREKQKQLNKKGKASMEALWKTKAGETINVLINCTYLNPEKPEEGTTCTALDITQRKRYEEHLNYLSFHDSLTGLNNRAYLEEKIDLLDREENLPISIIMADINGLKMINDAYGHKVGDQLLKRASGLMRECCGEKGFLARWGGDEFMFFLPQTDRRAAENLALEIKGACQGEKIEGVPLSISFGISGKEKMEKGLPEILKEAEDQMYQRKLGESRSVRSTVLSAILKTLGLKSDETEEHALRMQKLSRELGEKLNLPQAELDRLLLLVSLHDIGKISIGEDILRKPDRLNEEEWEIVKKHPEIGYRLAVSTGEFAHIAEEILSHHEHWNGGGYPRGMEGKNIPLLARIIAIIDAFDVMTNGRPYKKPMSQREALEELERCAGTQFDPELIKIFVDMIRGENPRVSSNFYLQGGI